MKPGRVKRVFGSIGSPFYSSFHAVSLCSLGRGLIQRCDDAYSRARVLKLRLYSSCSSFQSIPNLPFTHSSMTRNQSKARYRFPLVLTSAITCCRRHRQSGGLGGGPLPTGTVAQHRPTTH